MHLPERQHEEGDIDQAWRAQSDVGAQLNRVMKRAALEFDLNLRECHMMAGMLTGSLLATGFANVVQTNGVDDAVRWLNSLLTSATDMMAADHPQHAVTIFSKIVEGE